MREIKFVSYDGKYPNLCSGTLVLSIENENKSFDYCLSSGGGVWFDDDWCEHVDSGEWGFRDEYSFFSDEEVKYINFLVNENIEHGCCGGCV